MMLEVHSPYPGTALAVTEIGSILFGAPTDSFKATKKYCTETGLPFPRVLVTPTSMLVRSVPQFNPEFFLYDFLFIYGAAFNPELSEQKLQIVTDRNQTNQLVETLRVTLTGPTEAELNSYRNDAGNPLVTPEDVRLLTGVSSHMAIKKEGAERPIEDMVEFVTYDSQNEVQLLDGQVQVLRGAGNSFTVRRGNKEEHIDLSTEARILPFASLPIPTTLQRPERFGVKPLGVRSGFDLSGASTGFLIWVEGNVCIYDGPVGTRYLLETHGINCDDISMIVLSHCHEDHMGAFVELILSGTRPRVYTTEPIYRSALVKLSSAFQLSEAEVARFIDYHPVQPGVPFDYLGASFELFYTIHAIPTVGIAVSYPSGSSQYRIVISGDTYHHEGLHTLLNTGVIETGIYERMKHLVPPKTNQNSLYFCDVGESLIHGHPNDWLTNPNRVVYYHCPDNPHTRSFGRELAVPGQTVSLAPNNASVKGVPPRLMSALRFLNLTSPHWQNRLIEEGTLSEFNTGAMIARRGDPLNESLFILVTGLGLATNPSEDPFKILPGEFFGFNERINEDGLSLNDIKALCPSEILEIKAELLSEYIRESGLKEHLQAIKAIRPLIDQISLFKGLKIGTRNWLAGNAHHHHHPQNSIIARQGDPADRFFVLLDGQVLLESSEKPITEINSNSTHNFFGAPSVLTPELPCGATALALSNVELLQFSPETIMDLFNYDTQIHFRLNDAARSRFPLQPPKKESS